MDPVSLETPTPAPVSTLHLYRRLFKGRKALFAESDTAPASYYLINPVPHKHANTWKPKFYRGDNPKHTPSTTAIGRARRSAWWGTFRIWLGDGVHTVLENEKRQRDQRRQETKNKFRRVFGRKQKPVVVEEQEEVTGKVILVRMWRVGGVSRKVVFEVEGVRYCWSGTRMFSKGAMRGVKGWSHNMKLVRISDHALIATVEKYRWALWKRSIKSDGPPNKKKLLIATLTFYDRFHPGVAPLSPGSKLASAVARVDEVINKPNIKDEDGLNPNGPHEGNITEDAIAFSAWCVLEAEHRLRHKIEDILEEIGETIQG